MADASGPRSDKELTTGTLLEQFGGVKGMIDSSIPATLFVVVRFFASLNVSIAAAVAAGLLVVGLRRVQGETLQHAFSGFFGLRCWWSAAQAPGRASSCPES